MPGGRSRTLSADAGKSRGPLDGVRCLAFDDDFLIALDVQEILLSAGAASVTSVAAIREAMASLDKDGPFDVAVLDLGPDRRDTSGAELHRALKERGTPFVFLTGMSSKDERALLYPEAPVVDKPYQAGELLAAVRRVLRKR